MIRNINRASRAAALTAALLVTSIAGAQTIAITGGKVFPVSGSPIDNGTVLIRDGKIVAVGANVAVPGDAQRIDATGKWVTPGLINSATQLGLVEVGQVRETRDDAARGKDNIAAAFRVWEGLNTQSVMIAPSRRDGVTSVVVLPTGDQLVSGQAAILNLVDGMPSDMVLKTPIAMMAQVQNPQDAGTNARGELLVRLRELIEDTRAFMRNRAAYERAETRSYIASRLDLEAMIPVVEGKLPLLIAADKATDIDAALRIAKENGLKIMIGGGAEAWLVADKLAAAHVPVLTGAMNNIPGSFQTLATAQENAGLLRKAGVQVLIVGNAGGGDEEAFNVRNIKQEAGNAVAYGMTWNDALRAVTLTPAEVFGVSDRVGSLQPGRDGNVVIWSGDPFEFTTVAEHVYVLGHEYTAPDRQQLLTEKYKHLPPQQNTPTLH
ncbi:MAG TPA: amidohydrolase family protein [Gemmatimonadaceae bacterium]|nr:amidohydrolase family protein [Gemmatimonadaceae bacterium]